MDCVVNKNVAVVQLWSKSTQNIMTLVFWMITSVERTGSSLNCSITKKFFT